MSGRGDDACISRTDDRIRIGKGEMMREAGWSQS